MTYNLFNVVNIYIKIKCKWYDAILWWHYEFSLVSTFNKNVNISYSFEIKKVRYLEFTNFCFVLVYLYEYMSCLIDMVNLDCKIDTIIDKE